MFKITAEFVPRGLPDKYISIPSRQASVCSPGTEKADPSCHLGSPTCFYRHSLFSGLDEDLARRASLLERSLSGSQRLPSWVLCLLRRGRKKGREGREGRRGAEEEKVKKGRGGGGQDEKRDRRRRSRREDEGGGEKEEEEVACQYGRCVLSCVAAYLGTTTPNSAPLRLKMTRQLLAL